MSSISSGSISPSEYILRKRDLKEGRYIGFVFTQHAKRG